MLPFFSLSPVLSSPPLTCCLLSSFPLHTTPLRYLTSPFPSPAYIRLSHLLSLLQTVPLSACHGLLLPSFLMYFFPSYLLSHLISPLCCPHLTSYFLFCSHLSSSLTSCLLFLIDFVLLSYRYFCLSCHSVSIPFPYFVFLV